MEEDKFDKKLIPNENLSEEQVLFIKEFLKAEESNLRKLIYSKANVRFIKTAGKYNTSELLKMVKENFEKIENGDVKAKDLEYYEEIITLLLIAITMKEKVKNTEDNGTPSNKKQTVDER